MVCRQVAANFEGTSETFFEEKEIKFTHICDCDYVHAFDEILNIKFQVIVPISDFTFLMIAFFAENLL